MTSTVLNTLIASTRPRYFPITTRSVTLYGRNMISVTPAAKFDSEPCSARPIVMPAAPTSATIAVVRTPTVSSATTVSAMNITA